ncbi:MAG: carbon-phosphorus lyase complex subunit PhnI [Chloroflexota bacterium]|nr:carbon-phosphorus lyase complex subunit PhnI [Chloroflexota bacterium]
MAYTSVRAGAEAIAAAERLIQSPGLENGEALLELRQVRNQFRAAVDQIMGEGGLYAPDLAALALRQAEGDMAEAAFMLRAYRSTLPRLGYAHPVRGDEMEVVRRISSAFRDIPGGQLLGRTRDYTQRLLDLDRQTANAFVAPERSENGHAPAPNGAGSWSGYAKKVSDTMRAMGLIPPLVDQTAEPDDITRHSMRFPVRRPAWLQGLARGETGALVCLAYSALRGYGGGDHGTIADLRVGDLPLRVTHPFTNQPLTIGTYRVTECEMTGREKPPATAAGNGHHQPAMYGLSYGLVFGQNERKAISMSVLDSALMAGAGGGEENPAPANDQEMVLSNTDGIESFGFVEHLKLPHFVTFGSGLQVTEQLNLAAATPANGHGPGPAEDVDDEFRQDEGDPA